MPKNSNSGSDLATYIASNAELLLSTIQLLYIRCGNESYAVGI